MKTLTALILFLHLTVLTGLAGTPPKELTTQQAQTAMDILVKGHGTAVVNGVRSDPKDGETVVEVTFKNLVYTNPDTKKSHTYSGPGEAVFQGYTDGKWVLKRFSFTDPDGGKEVGAFNAHWIFNCNIPVE